MLVCVWVRFFFLLAFINKFMSYKNVLHSVGICVGMCVGKVLFLTCYFRSFDVKTGLISHLKPAIVKARVHVGCRIVANLKFRS